MRRTMLVTGIAIALRLTGSLALVSWLTRAPGSARSAQAAPLSAPPAPVAIAPARGGASRDPGTRRATAPEPVSAGAAAARTSREPQRQAPQLAQGGTPTSIHVSFQLDPRLTAGLHMGERWVSPPRYAGAQTGNVFTVKARAQAPGPGRRRLDEARWSAAEPDMVALSPDRGEQVELTVLRAGESRLTVSDGGASKTLLVTAVHERGVFRVDITQ